MSLTASLTDWLLACGLGKGSPRLEGPAGGLGAHLTFLLRKLWPSSKRFSDTADSEAGWLLRVKGALSSRLRVKLGAQPAALPNTPPSGVSESYFFEVEPIWLT